MASPRSTQLTCGVNAGKPAAVPSPCFARLALLLLVPPARASPLSTSPHSSSTAAASTAMPASPSSRARASRLSCAASVAALVALAGSTQQVQAAYNLTKDYSGATFFDGWDFYGAPSSSPLPSSSSSWRRQRTSRSGSRANQRRCVLAGNYDNLTNVRATRADHLSEARELGAALVRRARLADRETLTRPLALCCAGRHHLRQPERLVRLGVRLGQRASSFSSFSSSSFSSRSSFSRPRHVLTSPP